MTAFEQNLLGRVARSLAEARHNLNALRANVKGEALEFVEEMDVAIKALSDDAKADHSSGLMCALHEAMGGGPVPNVQPYAVATWVKEADEHILGVRIIEARTELEALDAGIEVCEQMEQTVVKVTARPATEVTTS
jgi:hypothetical protein